MTRLLIVNADDYGLSPGVSGGILGAAQSGIVSSTTVMANLATPTEVAALKEQGLSCGVHLNLTRGRPVSGYPVELLDASGCFAKELALEPGTWMNAKYASAAEAEWSAQIIALQVAGLDVAHIDSHHHVHLLEPLFPFALRLAAQYNLGLRTRSAQVPQVRAAGLNCPDELVEGYFGSGNIDGSRLLELLDAASGGAVEVMCHPGRVDPALKECSSYLLEREMELEVLGDSELKSMVEELGWRLGGYGELERSNANAS